LGFRIEERRLRRAGMDYWEHLEWEAVDDWAALCQRLDLQRMWFFTKTATQLYTAAAYQPGDVLVFGSESSGLPASILEPSRARCLRIPMRPQARSLNLAVSVGAAVYEALRQLPAID
jgi:tRNA (cytidine/uridine-2'-O-)-methyltransferase